MASSIHDAIWEWFLGCAQVTKLFFNFSEAEDEATVISTSGDTVLESYIDGSQMRRYAFDLIRFLPASFEENDESNITMMEDVDVITEWVQQQAYDGNFPELPSGYTVDDVIILYTESGYVAAQDQTLAKYMIPLAVDYIKPARQ